jgi:hypothetical protein
MALSDYLGFGFMTIFGLWWIIFPKSVISFYTWFHRGKIKLPPPSGIRAAGAIWMAIVVGILISVLLRR